MATSTPTEPIVDADVVEEPEPTGTDGAAATEPSTALALVEPRAGAIIAAEEPREILRKAHEIAAPLAELIESAGLAANVGGRRKHVEVGGWQACGTLLGALGGQPLHAETVWTRRVTGDDGQPHRTTYTAKVTRYHKREQGGGIRETVEYDVDGFDWEACVEVKTPSGVIVGRAEAMVSRAEETWNRRDDYALRSMAETRAESRAWRKAIGWIVHLAGYNPTPAEEMGHTPGADTAPAATTPAEPFGEKVSGADRQALMEALRQLAIPQPGIDAEDDKARVKAVAAAILGHAGGYMPRVVAHAILEVAHARDIASRTERPAEPSPAPPVETAAGAPAAPSTGASEGGGTAPLPGSVPKPDTTNATAVVAQRKLRAAGCICEDPLAAPEHLDSTCPLQGHGLPW